MADKKSTRKDSRSKNWVCIVYPDEVNADWRERINNQHFQWVESPLHDKDVNADGTPKKPHIHILLMFSSNKSREQVKDFVKTLSDIVYIDGKESVKGIAENVQDCRSIKAMIRYFAHVDNPEKYQYDVKDVIGHNGIDVSAYFVLTAFNRYECIKDMIAYIQQNDVREFIDFMSYCAENRQDDWFKLLCDNSSVVIGMCIKSQRHKPKESKNDVSVLANAAIAEQGADDENN